MIDWWWIQLNINRLQLVVVVAHNHNDHLCKIIIIHFESFFFGSICFHNLWPSLVKLWKWMWIIIIIIITNFRIFWICFCAMCVCVCTYYEWMAIWQMQEIKWNVYQFTIYTTIANMAKHGNDHGSYINTHNNINIDIDNMIFELVVQVNEEILVSYYPAFFSNSVA